MAHAQVGSKTPKYIPADRDERKLIANAGGGTLFYGGEAVTTESNDGELEAGESLVFSAGAWFISETETAVAIIPTSELGGGDLATQEELEEETSAREAADALRVLKETTAAATTTDILVTKVTEDTKNRFVLNADGKQEWGKGEATAADTTLERSGVKTLKTQNLQLTEELEVDGDLNHDGSKVGFFATAPAVQPEVKKVALTADELATALATLGILKIEA